MQPLVTPKVCTALKSRSLGEMKVFTALLAEISVKMLIYYQKRENKVSVESKYTVIVCSITLEVSRVAYSLSGNMVIGASSTNLIPTNLSPCHPIYLKCSAVQVCQLMFLHVIVIKVSFVVIQVKINV